MVKSPCKTYNHIFAVLGDEQKHEKIYSKIIHADDSAEKMVLDGHLIISCNSDIACMTIKLHGSDVKDREITIS